MYRSLLLVLSLIFGLATAQIPAFSQQYAQRMGGAIDELSRIIADFDADAAALGLDRAAALEELQNAGRVAAARAHRLSLTVARHDRLAASLADMQSGSDVTRAIGLLKNADRALAARTWASFEPALPLTPAGFGFGLFGALGVFGLGRALLAARRFFIPPRTAK